MFQTCGVPGPNSVPSGMHSVPCPQFSYGCWLVWCHMCPRGIIVFSSTYREQGEFCVIWWQGEAVMYFLVIVKNLCPDTCP